MDSKVNKIACITGASSGIGYATAKELARLGYDIIAVARRMDLLIELEKELNENCQTAECKVYLAELDVRNLVRVQSFYENLPEITKGNSAVVRFATQVIDENGKAISGIYQHPKLELATDFLVRKFKGGTRSSLSEYFFKKEKVDAIQLKDFPLAWYSDLLAVVEFTEFKMIYTINEAVVSFRLSGKNITSKTDDFVVKNQATFSFYYYLLHYHGKEFSKELQQLLFDRLEKTLLDNKKQMKAWVQLLYLYLLFLEGKRFLLLSLKIKKSIR